MTGPVDRIADVVADDLCIGCGLCEALSDGQVRMAMTSKGGLRPSPTDGFDHEVERALLSACPGRVATGRPLSTGYTDPIWGSYTTMRYGWSGDPDIRHRSATGGVLTSLGVHALERSLAAFVLHVGADPQQPMRSRWILSETREAVIANSGSRYGPTAPLAGLNAALERAEPFVVIAKPCDLGAIHSYAQVEPRVDDYCVMRLAMVCGGQSRLTKSAAVLEDLGLTEEEISLFRYRGYGNPGATRVETRDGRTFERAYAQMWADEGRWDLESRCKLCPDALGEAADIVVGDVWPGGAPEAEDEGFSGVVVRSPAGETLIDSAVAAGLLVVGESIEARTFDDMQPHQVRKKVAMAARYEGMLAAGVSPIVTTGLRIGDLGQRLGPAEWDAERKGTQQRLAEASPGERIL